jgi:hypothetical protein
MTMATTSLRETRWLKWLGQIVAYGLFVAFIGAFSDSPAYRHLAQDTATIKLSLRHAGQLLGECRQRTAEELANLPANMRAPAVCPRERSPIVLELDLNGALVYSETLAARGIHNDGRASVYRRLSVPAGKTSLTVRLKDHVARDVFQYTNSHQVELEPAEVLVIDFDEQRGQFDFL